jgi:peroxiredoxin
MSLNERLAALTAQFKSAMSADESAVVEQAAELLRRSGIADRAVKVGQAAPDFTLKDEDGTSVSLAQTRERGPVIVTFYRGVWCPYCNEDLKALQAALPTFRSMGASLISISPQSPANSRKSKRDNGLDYPILSDQGNAVADRYGLAYSFPNDLRQLYIRWGINLEAFNGDASWRLPIPGRFVVQPDGLIAYAEVDPDYTRRPDPSELIPVLDRLATAA